MTLHLQCPACDTCAPAACELLRPQVKGKQNWASGRQMTVQQWHTVHDAMKAAGPAGLSTQQVKELASSLGLEYAQVHCNHDSS